VFFHRPKKKKIYLHVCNNSIETVRRVYSCSWKTAHRTIVNSNYLHVCLPCTERINAYFNVIYCFYKRAHFGTYLTMINCAKISYRYFVVGSVVFNGLTGIMAITSGVARKFAWGGG